MAIAWVVGGAGFIGSNLCALLLKENYTVICIDNLITSSQDPIKDLLENKNFTFFNQDIINPNYSELEKAGKPDFIFHLASPASPNKNSKRSYIAYPIETLLVNSQGTYNLLEIAIKYNSKFLFASTSEIYGDPDISPQIETYNGNVNPNGVRSVYDEAKRFGEAITMAYVRKYNLDARIIRIFNTYGPNMQSDDGRVVSSFIMQALSNKPITIYGKGQQTRSFCYVSDMINGIVSAMFKSSTKGQVINLGNPIEKTILELATMIKAETNSDSQVIFEDLPEDDPRQRRPDITKAKDLLNWEPEIELRQGLAKTIEYFRNF